MQVDLDALTVSNNPTGKVMFKLTDLAGWYSSAPVRTEATNAPLTDGAFAPSRSYRGSKALSLEGVSYGGTEEQAIEQAWQMIAALAPQGRSMTLRVTDASGIKTMRVWLNNGPQVLPFKANAARFQIPLIAPDPRKYGETVTYLSTPRTTVSGGLVFPLGGNPTDPYLDFGAFTPSGTQVLQNEGTAETWPTYKILGSIASPGFQITSDTDTVQYSAAVAVGQELILSPYAGGRAVLGGVDVTQNLTLSQWGSIPPGDSRTYVFTALGAVDTNALLTTMVRPAWW
jgi:hypothetical protein